MIETFENRFDIKYLKLLSQKLEPAYLKSTAKEVRKELWKPFKPARNKSTIYLRKAIKIDFCGFAGTTLLGTNSKEHYADIKKLYPDPKQYNEIINLKEEIRLKFKSLLSDKTLADFNKSGVFLRIRFCYPYLYSDFPISLMRGEASNIWNARMDQDVCFSDNAPMTVKEWEQSFLYRSQKESLLTIGRLCAEHPTFSRIREYDTAINTFETRFAVIPIPVCVLIINDTAISDSYLYAKVSNENHLAVSTPVNLVYRDLIDPKTKEKKEHPTFNILRQNFLYIWRHDITMYADMCTAFKESNPLGLGTLLPPFVPGKDNVPNINWKTKIDRIIKRKRKIDKNYDPDTPEEKLNIVQWKKNVLIKIGLNTRKLQEEVTAIDSNILYIEIGKKGLYHFVSIHKHDADRPFFYSQNRAHIAAFCAIARFAYAKKHYPNSGSEANEMFKDKTAIKKDIKRWLTKKGRIPDKNIASEALFNALFDNSNDDWKFLIPDEHIIFNKPEIINTVKYKGKSCLDGLYPSKKPAPNK